ncbi:MAG: HdeD family acid-resistance protein [Nitrososphaeraceae archaeon]
MKESNSKTHGWMRLAQIGLGIIAIIISLIVLTFPVFTTISLVYFISILFFIVGIEKIITGIFFKSKSRLASIGLGVLVLILAGLALMFPFVATSVVIYVIAFALLFDGISRITHGAGEKSESKIDRFFGIGVGVLSVAISIFIMVSPVFGFAFVGYLIGIAILITGIQILVAGVRGRKMGFIPPTIGANE